MACNVEHNRLLGKTAVVLPAGCPCSVGGYYVQGIAGRKVKVPTIPGAGGAMVT